MFRTMILILVGLHLLYGLLTLVAMMLFSTEFPFYTHDPVAIIIAVAIPTALIDPIRESLRRRP